MERRKFLKAAGVGAAASVIAAPAIAQSSPEVKWRMTSSFPKSLDTLFGGAEVLAKRVAEATDNKFQIQVFSAGEIVPALQVLDAVQANTVQAGHTASYYYIGKDPTFAFATAIPFGPNTRQHNAWMYQGGGIAAMNEFYKEYNVIGIPAGNTCGQMGGWFRKEIKTLEDLKGLKYRIGGFAGQVLTKLGVVPQQIPGGEIYPALEKGTVDAAEWVGPYDDEKLGFNKIAKFYYYPGWWEGSAGLTAMFNLGEFQKLPKNYQSILEAACADANMWMMSKYDAVNPAALRKLIAGGTQLRGFPREVMEACYDSAQALYAETNAKNAKFKKIYDQWRDFRNSQLEWFRVTENSFDSYMMSKSRERKV